MKLADIENKFLVCYNNYVCASDTVYRKIRCSGQMTVAGKV